MGHTQPFSLKNSRAHPIHYANVASVKEGSRGLSLRWELNLPPFLALAPDQVSDVLQDEQSPAWDLVALLLCRQLQDIGQTPNAGFPKCLAVWRSLPITIRSCIFLPQAGAGFGPGTCLPTLIWLWFEKDGGLNSHLMLFSCRSLPDPLRHHAGPSRPPSLLHGVLPGTVCQLGTRVRLENSPSFSRSVLSFIRVVFWREPWESLWVLFFPQC